MGLGTIFGIVFESEGAENVKKDYAEVAQAETKAEQSAKKLVEQQDKLTKSTGTLIQKVAGLIGAYVGFKKIASTVMDFSAQGEQLDLLAQSAGVGVDVIQKYGKALTQYGGGMSSATSTLSGLAQKLNDLRYGRDGAFRDVAVRYGISVQGANGLATPEEMLMNISRRMQTLNSQQQMDLGKMLGLDMPTILLLRQGVDGLAESLNKASKNIIFSEKDILLTKKYNSALRDFRGSIDRIYAIIARVLTPVFTKFYEIMARFFGYLSQHKGAVLTFFAIFAGLLTVLAVKAGIASLAMLGVTAPVLLTIGALIALGAAIALVVDDFVTFMEGGESCIGAVLDAFKDFWNWLKQSGNNFSEWIEDIVNQFGEAFARRFDGIKELFESFINLIKDYANEIGSIFEIIFESIIAPFKSVYNMISGLLGKGNLPNIDMDLVNKGQQAIDETRVPLASMPQHIVNGGDSSQTIKIDNVEVNTQATDAEGISNSISDSLQQSLQSLSRQNAGGLQA